MPGFAIPNCPTCKGKGTRPGVLLNDEKPEKCWCTSVLIQKAVQSGTAFHYAKEESGMYRVLAQKVQTGQPLQPLEIELSRAYIAQYVIVSASQLIQTGMHMAMQSGSRHHGLLQYTPPELDIVLEACAALATTDDIMKLRQVLSLYGMDPFLPL